VPADPSSPNQGGQSGQEEDQETSPQAGAGVPGQAGTTNGQVSPSAPGSAVQPGEQGGEEQPSEPLPPAGNVVQAEGKAFKFVFEVDGSEGQEEEEPNHGWALECVLSFRPATKTGEMLSGWSTGNVLESLNQISLTLEPEGEAPSDSLYASLSITAVSAAQTNEILRKDDVFEIENYIGKKLQLSIALEEDTNGKTALTVREGEDDTILYDSSEAGWTNKDMELFDMLRREVNAETLADLQYVPEFNVYQADY